MKNVIIYLLHLFIQALITYGIINILVCLMYKCFGLEYNILQGTGIYIFILLYRIADDKSSKKN